MSSQVFTQSMYGRKRGINKEKRELGVKGYSGSDRDKAKEGAEIKDPV
jgi:hypothetical protein